MRREVQTFLQSRPDLLQFVREQPYWYRLLSRNPNYIYEIEDHSRSYHGETFPQKMGKFNEQLQMISMLLSLSSAMGESDRD